VEQMGYNVYIGTRRDEMNKKEKKITVYLVFRKDIPNESASGRFLNQKDAEACLNRFYEKGIDCWMQAEFMSPEEAVRAVNE
jgi:hypothetical protein